MVDKAQEWLEAAKHREITEKIMPPGKNPTESMALIGALSFLGRIAEAEELFKLTASTLKPWQLVRARFLLGIAFVRVSDKEKAKAYLRANLAARSAWVHPDTWQGIGIYYYYQAQFAKAAHYARRALSLSMKTKDTYLRSFATDLYGHSLVQLGQRAKGIRYLKEAQTIGAHSGGEKRFRPDILIYEGEAGLRPKEILEELYALLDFNQDSFTRSHVILEVARQLTLRGRWQEARELLDRESSSIYSFENRSKEITLQLRLAELSYLQGEGLNCLHFIQSAKRLVRRTEDKISLLQIWGLEWKVNRTLLNDTAGAEAARDALVKLQAQIQNKTTDRILARAENFLSSSGTQPGEDPLGDLLDQIASDPKKAKARVVDWGFLGLLPQCMGWAPGTEHFHLEPSGSWIWAHPKGVTMAQGSLPLQSQKILLSLSRGQKSKEDLIKDIWGYAYDPLRHDSLIYSAMTALRKSLGEASAIISTFDQGWGLRKLEFTRENENKARASEKSSSSKTPDEASSDDFIPGLNWRQLGALEKYPELRGWTISAYRSFFSVSTMTSWRDLDGLVKLGYFYKTGRGRSTSYLLREG